MAGVLQLSAAAVAGESQNSTTWARVGEVSANSLASGTEAVFQTTWRTAGIFSSLYASVKTNTLSLATSTIRLRKNTANGNSVISYAATVAGEAQDNSNSDSVVVGDILNYQMSIPNSGSGTITANCFGIQFAATTNTVIRISTAGTKTLTAATNTTYYSFAGDISQSSSTETTRQFKAKATSTFQNLQVNVTVNTRTDTNTVNFRKGAASGNGVISILTTVTGTLEDTSNTDSIVSGDLVNFRVLTGSDGAHTMSLVMIAIESSTTNATAYMACGIKSGTDAANSTFFDSIQGQRTADTTEANVQAKANFAYTASNLITDLAANSVSATSTVNFRKNAGNGNQTVSITASTAGFFEDATHTDAIVGSDEINTQLLTGATGTNLQPANIAHLVTISTNAKIRHKVTNQ